MKIIVFVAKTGDWLVSFVAAILATVMLLYGGYALWDTAMLYQGAFVSQNLMKYKPSVSVDEDDAGLNELLAINPDVRGWLTIDGTHVDYTGRRLYGICKQRCVWRVFIVRDHFFGQ